ncbi:hypothetical protein H1R20_g16283, partial [Candolleomyces eurysporus]
MLSLASASRNRSLLEVYSWCASSRPTQLSQNSAVLASRPCRHPPHRRLQHLAKFDDQAPAKTHTESQTLNKPVNSWKAANAPPLLDQDTAIAHALKGDSEHLYRCLASSLQQGDIDSVIRLYDRYASEYQAAGSVAAETSEPKEWVEELEVEDENRQRALLCAVTAHAKKRSFEPLLHAYLKAGMPQVTRSVRTEHLKKLSTSEFHEATILSYIQKLSIAFFVSNPGRLTGYVKALSRDSATVTLSNLYYRILEAIKGPNPFVAACESHQSSLPLSMTEAAWAAFLPGFVRCQRKDLAEKLWSDLNELGVRRGTGLWTALIDSFGPLRLSGPAITAWAQMISEGVKPDAHTYQAMIETLFRDKQPQLGLQKFVEFQQRLEKDTDPAFRLTVYNTVLDGLLRNQLTPKGLEFVEMMKKLGPAPDVITYNTLLKYYNRRRDFKGLQSVIADMQASEVQGDVYSFSTILSALLKVKRKDAMEVVLQCMEEQGVEPNVAIYSALIDHQLRTNDEGHLRSSLSLLQDMERDKTGKLSPNNVTYTSFLTNLHRGRWLSLEKREHYRQDVLRRMQDQGIKLTLPDYHIILKAAFEDEDSDHGVRSALWYYKDIRRRGIPCVNTTFYILLAGLIEHKEWDFARDIVQDIQLSGIKPSASLLNLMYVVGQQTL